MMINQTSRLKRFQHVSKRTWDEPNKYSFSSLHKYSIKESEAIADWFTNHLRFLGISFVVSLLAFLLSFKFITISSVMLFPFMLSVTALGSLFFMFIYALINIIFYRLNKKF